MSNKHAHSHTIGTVEWDGKTYDVDWPFDINDETQRDELTALIYLGKEEVAEVPSGWGESWTSEKQVLDAAHAFIVGGGLDD